MDRRLLSQPLRNHPELTPTKMVCLIRVLPAKLQMV
jgi:hypothetical protein